MLRAKAVWGRLCMLAFLALLLALVLPATAQTESTTYLSTDSTYCAWCDHAPRSTMVGNAPPNNFFFFRGLFLRFLFVSPPPPNLVFCFLLWCSTDVTFAFTPVTGFSMPISSCVTASSCGVFYIRNSGNGLDAVTTSGIVSVRIQDSSARWLSPSHTFTAIVFSRGEIRALYANSPLNLLQAFICPISR